MSIELQVGSRSLQNRAFLGVLLMLGGLLLYPVSDAFIKHLMGTYSIHQTTFLRALMRTIPLMIAALFQGGLTHVLATSRVRDHLIRLGVSLIYTLAFMVSFKLGTLTIVYTLSYTSPLFMVLLSAWVLKERVSFERWIAVGVGIVGILIAVQPNAHFGEVAALLVLFGTFLGALNKILMRRLASTEHTLAITIYPNLVMLCVMPLFFFVQPWKPMPLEHWGLFAIVGLLTGASQYLIAQALRFTQVSLLASIDYSAFLWVIALDYIWWDQIIELPTLIGALLIISSNLFILYLTKSQFEK